MNPLTVTDVRVHPGDSAFLLDDGTTSILYDSGFGFTGFGVADNICRQLGDRKLDYIFLTHSHYDHALGSACITQRYPNVKAAAGQYAADVFSRPGALKVMAELDEKIARRCGAEEYTFPGEGLRVDIPLSDGDVITAGGITFEAIALPGHTRCSMGFYCRERFLLLSCETLGVFDGRQTIAPAYLTGYQTALDSIERVRQLDIRQMISPHMGLMNEEQTAWFLAHAADAARDAAQRICCLLEQDASEEDIFADYMERYVRGRFEDIYPVDAARLNVSIMTKLIGKELLGK